MLKSRISTLQRQEFKSVSRVSKLEKAKTTVIEAKVRREEVRHKRKEAQVWKALEKEVKKVRVGEIKREEEGRAKKVREEVLKKK